MEDTIAKLFKLDKDEGYAIQVVVWRNGEDHWDRDHMIQSYDFDDEGSIRATTRRLTRFLDQYKKVPLNASIKKSAFRGESSGSRGHRLRYKKVAK